jgi:hypothetical protein
LSSREFCSDPNATASSVCLRISKPRGVRTGASIMIYAALRSHWTGTLALRMCALLMPEIKARCAVEDIFTVSK